MTAPKLTARPPAGRNLRAVLVALSLCGLLLSGCASSAPSKPPQVTVGEIVAMSQNHVPAEQIVAQIRASGTVYRLKADQLAQLKAEGVPDEVLNYMQQTYIDAVRHDQALQDWNRWVLEDDGFWYGGAPFGWAYFGEPYAWSYPRDSAGHEERERQREHASHEVHPQQQGLVEQERR